MMNRRLALGGLLAFVFAPKRAIRKMIPGPKKVSLVVTITFDTKGFEDALRLIPNRSYAEYAKLVPQYAKVIS